MAEIEHCLTVPVEVLCRKCAFEYCPKSAILACAENGDCISFHSNGGVE